jgi:hypothetical protein
MVTTVLLYLGLFLAGLVAGLKVVAPLTKTTVDDKILDVAEKAEAVVVGLQPLPVPDPVTPVLC